MTEEYTPRYQTGPAGEVIQLPTLPGKTDGIVGWDPLELQCRACGAIYVGKRKSRATDIILSGFHFHTHVHTAGEKPVRMCPTCLAKAKAACEICRAAGGSR